MQLSSRQLLRQCRVPARCRSLNAKQRKLTGNMDTTIERLPYSREGATSAACMVSEYERPPLSHNRVHAGRAAYRHVGMRDTAAKGRACVQLTTHSRYSPPMHANHCRSPEQKYSPPPPPPPPHTRIIMCAHCTIDNYSQQVYNYYNTC